MEDLEDDDTSFSELGMNPTLAQCIISKVSQTCSVNLPEDIFEKHSDVGSLKEYLNTAFPTLSAPDVTTLLPNTTSPLSILISGNLTTATQILFLLPDGSGSAMAYARLPCISPTTAIYALNSPFLRSTSAYTCTIEQLASIWAAEIQTIQPAGPYLLGGWSAGGYYAFEVMKHFQRLCLPVSKLILIDSPSRNEFESLPLPVVQYLASHDLMGNWGAKATPQWLVDHFEATLKAVSLYRPTKLIPGLAKPEVFVIWAKDALLSRSEAEATGLDMSVKVTRCLLEGRQDFGPSGWDRLMPRADMAIAKMPGNHFGVIHPPNVSKLRVQG